LRSISLKLMLLDNLLGDGFDGNRALPLTPTLSSGEREQVKIR
jgi:hypothetical protein